MRSLVFPGDKAKRLKDAPAKRFDFSVRYLPLPAVFKSPAIALRALIREKRKQGAPFDEELAMLYRLAFLQDLYDSLLSRIPIRGNDPIPRVLWETATFDHSRIGHEKLSLLGVQDVRWFEHQLGPPAEHQSVIASEPETLPALSAFMAAARRGRARGTYRTHGCREAPAAHGTGEHLLVPGLREEAGGPGRNRLRPQPSFPAPRRPHGRNAAPGVGARGGRVGEPRAGFPPMTSIRVTWSGGWRPAAIRLRRWIPPRPRRRAGKP